MFCIICTNTRRERPPMSETVERSSLDLRYQHAAAEANGRKCPNDLGSRQERQPGEDLVVGGGGVICAHYTTESGIR